jgi:hypothetical protein
MPNSQSLGRAIAPIFGATPPGSGKPRDRTAPSTMKEKCDMATCVEKRFSPNSNYCEVHHREGQHRTRTSGREVSEKEVEQEKKEDDRNDKKAAKRK